MRPRDVIVIDSESGVCGIVTDRDIVVRALAGHRNPADTRLKDICSRDVVTVTPSTSTDEAVRIVREKSVRRLPVLDDDQPVGIVSLGDLAVEHDPKSALADISVAPPNR